MKIKGNNLLKLRESLGISQSEIAEKTGISRAYITMIESGVRASVSQATLNSLCRGLNTTVACLTEGKGWAYNPPSILRALQFVDTCLSKFKPSDIVIVTYYDDLATGTVQIKPPAKGFIFVASAGTISMSGSQTRLDCPGGIVAFRESMKMIESYKTRTGYVHLGKEISDALIHTDMNDLVLRAHRDIKIIWHDWDMVGEMKQVIP